MTTQSHIHAIAAVQQHGGRFAIAYDAADPHFEEENGAIVPRVLHVWSVHDTPSGPVARDARGEVPGRLGEMRDALRALFPEHADRDEVVIDAALGLEDIQEMSGERDYQPLCAVHLSDVLDAGRLPSVLVAPGAAPSPLRGRA